MKLPTLLALLVLTSVSQVNIARGADRLELNPQAVPPAFSLSNKPALSSTPSDTDCKAFTLKKGKQRVGMLCASGNKDLLVDFGVPSETGKDDILADASGSARSLQVATGSSIYPMESSVLNGMTLHSADVDCDERNEAIYRPTATCRITVALPGDGTFLYSSFVLEDHVTRATRANKSDISKLWSHLTLAKRSRLLDATR